MVPATQAGLGGRCQAYSGGSDQITPTWISPALIGQHVASFPNLDGQGIVVIIRHGPLWSIHQTLLSASNFWLSQGVSLLRVSHRLSEAWRPCTRRNWLPLSFDYSALKWSRSAADSNNISCFVRRRSCWSFVPKFAFWSLVRVPRHIKQQQWPVQLFTICLWQRELLTFFLSVDVADVVCAFCPI